MLLKKKISLRVKVIQTSILLLHHVQVMLAKSVKQTGKNNNQRKQQRLDNLTIHDTIIENNITCITQLLALANIQKREWEIRFSFLHPQ